MLKLINNYLGIYYLLYFFSFISIYKFPVVAPVLNIFLLGFSYYLIIRYRRFDVIIMLILYCRCLNGFIIPHHKLAYDIINFLTNIFPVLLYFTSVLYRNKVSLNSQLVNGKFTFTILFFLLLSFSFVFNFSTSYDLLTKRYLPFLFFVLFLFLFNKPSDFNVSGLIRFFRAVFLASIILYFLPGYLGITKALIESDSVFSVASPPNSYSLIYMSFVRNMGFIWDHRILAIFAYLFLLLILIFKPKYYKADILLSLIIVITSTSRGGMITYGLIFGAYLFIVYRYRLFAVLAGLLFLISIFVVFEKELVSPSASRFIRSFNPASKYNALSQRSFFSEYAIKSFKEKPVLGHGVGYLTSYTTDRKLIINGLSVPAVGDAYWYVLLAEMGIIGFLLFMMFLIEVFYSQSLLNVALLVGFAVQLLGTDIPDMRFYYFAILVLVYVANKELKTRFDKKRTLAV